MNPMTEIPRQKFGEFLCACECDIRALRIEKETTTLHYVDGVQYNHLFKIEALIKKDTWALVSEHTELCEAQTRLGEHALSCKMSVFDVGSSSVAVRFRDVKMVSVIGQSRKYIVVVDLHGSDNYVVCVDVGWCLDHAKQIVSALVSV